VERARLAAGAGGPPSRAVANSLGRAELPTAGSIDSQSVKAADTATTPRDSSCCPAGGSWNRPSGWLLRYRRLIRDYERRPEHHEAMVLWATIAIMTRKLAAQRPARHPIPDVDDPSP